MPLNFPIDFEELAALPRGLTNADYPYSIKATDLMRDYTYAALDAEEALIEEDVESNGYTVRRLKVAAGSQPGTLLRWEGENGWVEYLGSAPGELLTWDGEEWVTTTAPTQPNQIFYWNGSEWASFQPPPASGTYVLGSENGALTWLATEEC